MRRAAVVCLGLLLAGPVAAQELRGTVRDSATRQAIAGAVVMLLDGSGAGVGRTIAAGNGQYRLTLTDGTRRVRAVRIGFRPVEVGVPVSEDGLARLDFAMSPIPPLLTPVLVTENPRCPRRGDRPAALSLWEQARDGLLATVVARDVAPTSMTRLRFSRIMEGATARVARQQVVLDSANLTGVPFFAVRSAQDFVSTGFAHDSAQRWKYFGPDADILLDESFAFGYCFHLADAEAARPGQVGLAFGAADRKRGRTDIEGTLWVDTVARSLKEIAYHYLVPDVPRGLGQPGGRVAFRELANGLVVIDQWSIRVIGGHADTSYMDNGTRVLTVSNVAYEDGGELARADWPDGTTWRAALGTVRIRAVTAAGAPAAGVVIRLLNTDYEATADAQGFLEIADLVPGPYAAGVVDSALATVGLTIPTGIAFVAERDSVSDHRLRVPTVDKFVAGQCAADKRVRDPLQGTARVFARVMSSSSGPVQGLAWSIGVREPNGDLRLVQRGVVGADGQLQFCKLALNSTIGIILSRDGRTQLTLRRLDHETNIVPLAWSPR